MDTEPVQVSLDLVCIFLLGACRIRVVKTKDEAALVLQGEQPVEQRCAGVADMDVAGRRRGKSNCYGHLKVLLKTRAPSGTVAELVCDRIASIASEILFRDLHARGGLPS